MTSWPEPDASQQIIFLQQLQRLFQEGDFTSTYKYALLLALSELAIESPCAGGAPLTLSMVRIAEKFAEFYWTQTVPYFAHGSATSGGVLIQNNARQAAIIRHLSELRSVSGSTLSQARKHPHWQHTIHQIAAVVRKMPLRFLQNIPGSTVLFLYDPATVTAHLPLLPGVAFHLRRFQGFIQQLVRAGWVNHVRSNRLNAHLVGNGADLEAFMFGTPRAALSAVARILAPMQAHRCFFCQQPLNQSTAVDHFIPWSRYPRDTALNFVVAHASCNGDKRDLLAAGRHLERWLERNLREGATLAGELQQAGFVCEPGVAITVAAWAYQEGVSAGTRVWQARGSTELISPDVLLAFG